MTCVACKGPFDETIACACGSNLSRAEADARPDYAIACKRDWQRRQTLERIKKVDAGDLAGAYPRLFGRRNR